MKKIFLYIIGIISIVLGVAGIFLPLLPTTPFLLLAAFCLSKSSNKAYQFLTNNKYLGAYIENYHSKKGISRSVKVRSILTTWVLLFFSMVMVNRFILIVLLTCIGVGVTCHILSMKTKNDDE